MNKYILHYVKCGCPNESQELHFETLEQATEKAALLNVGNVQITITCGDKIMWINEEMAPDGEDLKARVAKCGPKPFF